MSTFSQFFGGGGGDSTHPAVRGNVVTGIFGTGENVQFFINSGTFIVPADITSVRVRLWGGGSRAGGGFAIKTITGLTPGGSISVTVGANDGGTSSFGAHVSATGATDISPGTGVGGDFNSTGGVGTGTNTGGGAAGIFGDGGGADGKSGNAGGGSTSATEPGGNGISGRGAHSNNSFNGEPGEVRALDYIATGGGGAGTRGAGANGGGGGGSQGKGGFPAGGAGNVTFSARGLVIVEF